MAFVQEGFLISDTPYFSLEDHNALDFVEKNMETKDDFGMKVLFDAPYPFLGKTYNHGYISSNSFFVFGETGNPKQYSDFDTQRGAGLYIKARDSDSTFMGYKRFSDRTVVRVVYEDFFGSTQLVSKLELSFFRDGVIQIVYSNPQYTYGLSYISLDSNNATPLDTYTDNIVRSIVLLPNNDNTYSINYNNMYGIEGYQAQPPVTNIVTERTRGGVKIKWDNPANETFSHVRIEGGNGFLAEVKNGANTFSFGGFMAGQHLSVNISAISSQKVYSEKIPISDYAMEIGSYMNDIGQFIKNSYPTATIPSSHGVGETVIFSGSNDDASTKFPNAFPFPVKFYGSEIQSIYVATNSFITFNQSSSQYNNFKTNDPMGIYVFPDDTRGRWAGYIKSADNNSFTIRNEVVDRSVTTSIFSWEITFFKNGIIQIYLDVAPNGFLTKGIDIRLSEPTKSIYHRFGLLEKQSITLFPPENPTINHFYYYDYGKYVLGTTNKTYPSPNIISTFKPKISNQSGFNTSVLKFTFDKDVAEWEVRVGGTGHGSGYLADSGGAVYSNIEIQAIIDSTELQNEGRNKINIYGKDSTGLWTPYQE